MLYVKFSRRLTDEQIGEKIACFEKKYGMTALEYEKKVVKGHEDELDEKDLLGDFEEWKHLSAVLAEGNKEPIIESFVKPMPFGGKVVNLEIGIITKTFTPERLRLLGMMKEKQLGSISKLSEAVKRDRSSVVTDLEILENAGLVQLQKHGKNTMPRSLWDKVEIEF